MKLRTKLSLGLAAILAAAILTTAALFWRVIRDEIKEGSVSQLAALATHAALGIEDDFADGIAMVEAVVRAMPDSAAQRPDELARFMHQLPVPAGALGRCIAIGPDGRGRAQQPTEIKLGDRSFSDRAYFREVMATRRLALSQPLRGAVSGSPVVVAAVPKLASDGSVVLVMACTLNLLESHMFGPARATKIGRSGYLYAVARDRTILMHPDPKRIMTVIPSGANAFLDRAVSGFEGTEEANTLRGERALISVRQLTLGEGFIAAVYPLEEAYEPVRDAGERVLLATFTAILVSAVAAWFLAGLLIAPLRRLTRQMRLLRASPDAPLEPARAGADEIGQLSGTFSDLIGELREREAAQRESAEDNRILRAALEQSEEGVVVADAAGSVTLWNHGAEQMFGWSAAEALGRTARELHLRDSPEPEIEDYRARLMRGESVQLVGQRRRKDGTTIQVISFITPLMDAQRAFAGSLATLRDVTELRRAEEELRLSEETFARAFDATPDAAIIARQSDGRLVAVNRAFERLTGYSAADALGKTALELGIWARPGEREGLVQGVRDNGEVRGFNVHFRVRSGDVVLVEGSVVRAEIGGEAHLVWVGRDVTEVRRAEAEVHRLNAELEQRVRERTAELESANRELESFSYSISHDLRAPLRAIAGFSRLVEEEHATQLSEAGKDMLQRVSRNAIRMGELIDDLLDFSRIGRAALKKTTVDMTALAREVAAELVEAEPGRKIELRIGALPETWGDRSLLRQVWINLLGNALKFTRGRAPAVIEVGAEVADGDVAYYVRDNGAGFEMQYADKLFKVFQRLHREASFEGTGIGLAIAARIVRRHGGQIAAEGAPDHGATFRVTLPAGTADTA